MPLKYTPDKIIQNRNYAVTDSAPKANQKKEIQWNVSTPRYTMNDLILDTQTFNQLFDVISYFKNRELLGDCQSGLLVRMDWLSTYMAIRELVRQWLLMQLQTNFRK